MYERVLSFFKTYPRSILLLAEDNNLYFLFNFFIPLSFKNFSICFPWAPAIGCKKEKQLILLIAHIELLTFILASYNSPKLVFEPQLSIFKILLLLILNIELVNIERELGNILGYEIVDNSNSLYNYTTGVLGSKLIVHNIYSKSFNEYHYNYFDRFDGEQHITSFHNKKQYPIFSDVSIEKGGARSSDFPSHRSFSLPIPQPFEVP